MSNRSPKNYGQTPVASSRITEAGNVDPWNWKMPSRQDLMSLNTLSEKKDLIRVQAANGLRTKRITSTNMQASDIFGAAPKVEIKKEITREIFYDNKDIKGAQTRALHVELKKDYCPMSNADIKGSKPQIFKFQTTRKDTNPLNPDYVLPHFEHTLPEPPKFIRDGHNIDDIEGCKAKKHQDKYLRDGMHTKDIFGTSPKRRPERKEAHDQEYKDVYAKKEKKRDNPLNPQEPKYLIRDENNNQIEIGEIAGARATEKYYRKNEEDIKVNTVKGIDYATTGTKYLGNFKDRERRGFRKTNDISDISGCQAKTLVKGIKLPPNMKRRETNPLNPNYQLPGSKEIPLDIQIDPFGRDGCSMTKNLYIQAVERPHTAQIYQSGHLQKDLQQHLDEQQLSQSQRSKIPSINSNLPRSEHGGAPQSARNIQGSGIRPPSQYSAAKPPQTPQTEGSKRSELQRRNTTQIVKSGSKHNSGAGSNRLPPASAKLSSKKSGLILQDPYQQAKENDSQGFNKSQSALNRSQRPLQSAKASQNRDGFNHTASQQSAAGLNRSQRPVQSAKASSKRSGGHPLSSAQKLDKFISQPI